MNLEKFLKEKKLNIEVGNFIIWVVFLMMVIKTIIFVIIGTSKTGYTVAVFVPIIKLLPTQLATILILIFPAYLFKNKKQLTYLLIIDLVYSIFLILNLWYFRASGEYLGIRYLIFPGLFNPMNRSLINLSWKDLIYIVDLPILFFILMKTKLFIDKKRNIKISIIGILVCIVAIYGTYYKYDVRRTDNGKTIFIGDDWGSTPEMRNMWPLAYNIYQDWKAIKAYNIKPNQEEMNVVDNWFKNNKENSKQNIDFGLLKGKNVIFVQMESLEDFVIGEKVYGQEITPVLNKLTKHSFYFKNVYEQNNGGNSIDCDMMVNTGMLTLGDSITFISNPYTEYPSMAKVLETDGYNSISTRAEPGGDYGWAKAHKNALGFKNIWDGNEYDFDEIVGFGLSDRTFYNQYIDKLSSEKAPFFSMIPNLSNHGPFDIKEKYRALNLPENLDKTKLGGYFQSSHYADEQLGFLINKLKKLGMMKDTILVIYGDHGGIHKYYNEELESIDLDGDWWQDYEKKIPLIIYSEGMKGKEIATIGGHMDIMPTVLNLLGVKSKVPLMGRDLLNTNINSTIIKGNEIIGNPSEKEKQHLEKAYTIAEYIIKNNYYKNNSMIK
ncbi:LTA synthase family protein [uncultured Clostridium sp.]|uniref:LTA synthase family protein n=1 Tax=uncultured Clostridium sp. TaxID=59620 RepID=UPI0026043474|nr:LTA synthase family protein [uncultured Clostridium sp.]